MMIKLVNQRFPEESYEDYRKRREFQNKLLKVYLKKGRPFYQSGTPVYDKHGRILFWEGQIPYVKQK